MGIVVVGCADGGSGDEVRVADAYAEIVQAVVHAEPVPEAPEDLIVWIYPRPEGASINLEVQVEVLEMLEEFATVRFVDAFEEAVDDVDDSTRVIDDGVVVGLSPVEPGDRESVAERFTNEDRQPVEYTVVRTGSSWQTADDSRT